MKEFVGQSFNLQGQTLILDDLHAMYWPSQETLFITDLHLGKVTHFRNAGMAIPNKIIQADYQRLDKLMNRYSISRWICLGDLFHSHWNEEHPLFMQWRKSYPHVEWILIEGNHDRYIKSHYAELEMAVYQSLDLQPFFLIHDWDKIDIPSNRYALSGHLHPSVRLYGKGKQQIKLPCFWFQPNGAYLPAFGQFTGTHVVTPSTDDQLFVIADQSVIKINCD